MTRIDRLVFVDTETTGLSWRRRPWEIALIACDASTGRQVLRLCVQIVDIDLTDADPKALEIGGFHTRHLGDATPVTAEDVLRADQAPVNMSMTEAEAARLVWDVTSGAQLVGVNPAFDAETLAAMLRRHRLTPPWHYHLYDVVAAGRGFLAAGNRLTTGAESSYELSRMCGAEPPAPERAHTALGDAEWVARWFDAINDNAEG